MSISKDLKKDYQAYSASYNRRRNENVPKLLDDVKEQLSEKMKHGAIPLDIRSIAVEISESFSETTSDFYFDLEVSNPVTIEVPGIEDFKIIRSIADKTKPDIKYYLVLDI